MLGIQDSSTMVGIEKNKKKQIGVGVSYRYVAVDGRCITAGPGWGTIAGAL